MIYKFINKNKQLCILISSILVVICANAKQETNSIEINTTAVAAAFSCMKRVPVGKCLYIDPITGKQDITTEWSMFLPDTTVTVHNQPGDIPWTEIRATKKTLLEQVLAQTFPDAVSTSGGHLRTNNGRTVTYFKEAAVIGFPGEVDKLASVSGYVCPRLTTPLTAYYHSETDGQAWRNRDGSGMTPQLMARQVGKKNHYGMMFDTSGFVTSSESAWANATIAQRVAYLATHGADPLLQAPRNITKIRLTSGQRGKTDGSHENETYVARENKPEVARWQVVLPKATRQCAQFDEGVIDDALDDLSNEKQSLVLNLWRCYRCCEPGSGIFMGRIASTVSRGKCAL